MSEYISYEGSYNGLFGAFEVLNWVRWACLVPSNHNLEMEKQLGICSSRGNGIGHHPLKRFGEVQKGFKRGRSYVMKREMGSSRKRRNGGWWVAYSIVVCFLIGCLMTLFFKLPEFYGHHQLGEHDSYDHGDGDVTQSLILSALQDPAYFGETIKLMPSKNLVKSLNSIGVRRNLKELHPFRRPRLALVCSDLSRSPGLLLLYSVAIGLQSLGYDLELYSLEDGPMRAIWEKLGTTVYVLQSDSEELKVDWLNFDGVFINTLEAKSLVSSLRQEPFSTVPLIWAIHESRLGMRLKEYASSKLKEVLIDWKETFQRANVVVFDDYTNLIIHSALDTGNFFVIPGSPTETWEAEHFMATQNGEDLRKKLGFDLSDFLIVVVGSPFTYKGVWLEHTLVMQAIMFLMSELKMQSGKQLLLKLVIMSGNNTTYGTALQAIAFQLGFPNGTVQHVGIYGHENDMLSIADLVVYSSLHEEQAFPDILLRAMSFEKPIVAPKLTIIQKYIEDGKHGILFPVGGVNMIAKAMSLVISNGRLSILAQKIALAGRLHARDVMASDAIVGYATLLENILQFPSAVVSPQPSSEIPEGVKRGWQWELFTGPYKSRIQSVEKYFKKQSVVFEVEDIWRSRHQMLGFLSNTSYRGDATIDLPYWEEEKANEIEEDTNTREIDELDRRTSQAKLTWEDVTRSVKRVERTKVEMYERDDGEMERTGQPLCIYEPYYGPGTWPFLHQGALYRGIGLDTKNLRAGTDDVDAPARLPLLSDVYLRDVLCEYGAYFAIANRVDQIHKNPWIGFQSWRAAGKKASLTEVAEKKLIDAITKGWHGDAVYFWVPMDIDVRHATQGTSFQQHDFWTFCDTINAGNCRSVFTNTLKRMYNLPERWTGLPPMPSDGGSWSALHSLAMPVSSFLELVMFARMFVDSLDAQYHEEQKVNGTCCLSISMMENRYCYCRLLELLVNVWAYHSARNIVYVDPETGRMQEQHRIENRKGKMWIKWFKFSQLKAMDEDLAEEADYDHPAKKWLWPKTGEVYWQGIYEREQQQQNSLKTLKKRKKKEKLDRMRLRYRQKSIGKYRKQTHMEVDKNRTERHAI